MVLDNCDEGTGPLGQSLAVTLTSGHCIEEQRRRQENGKSLLKVWTLDVSRVNMFHENQIV